MLFLSQVALIVCICAAEEDIGDYGHMHFLEGGDKEW